MKRILSDARMHGLALLALAFAAACADSTTGATVSTGPYYKVTPVIADLTAYPAGSVLSVRAIITHEGTAIPLTTVAWSVEAGGGIVSSTTAITDTLGAASINWVLGTTAGLNTLAILTADGSDTLHIVGAVGAASYLVIDASDSFTIAPGGSATLQARVTDRVGNAVQSATVKWTASGGSLSAASVASDASGNSSVSFTATVAGTYTITAELPGLATHLYQVVVQ